MDLCFSIDKILDKGIMDNEFEHKRAMAASKMLRFLYKDDIYFKKQWDKLVDIIIEYEKRVWSDVDKVTDRQVEESDEIEKIVEREERFVFKRKNKIKSRLEELNLTQQDLAHILGYKSKIHMMELMNGLAPFRRKDLIVMNRLLGIPFETLIPRFLSKKDVIHVKKAISDLNNPQIKFSRI